VCRVLSTDILQRSWIVRTSAILPSPNRVCKCQGRRRARVRVRSWWPVHPGSTRRARMSGWRRTGGSRVLWLWPRFRGWSFRWLFRACRGGGRGNPVSGETGSAARRSGVEGKILGRRLLSTVHDSRSFKLDELAAVLRQPSCEASDGFARPRRAVGVGAKQAVVVAVSTGALTLGATGTRSVTCWETILEKRDPAIPSSAVLFPVDLLDYLAFDQVGRSRSTRSEFRTSD